MGLIKEAKSAFYLVRMSGVCKHFGGSPMFPITHGFTLSLLPIIL